MRTVVGVFKSLNDAEHARAQIEPLRIPRDRINILTPGAGERELAAVPRAPGEQPGMGKAMGAVVGGAAGVGGGVALGDAIASLLVPGIGPVLAVGIAGGALLGAIGAVAGAAAGGAVERSVFEGVPEEELVVYRDALRQGRTVLIVMTETEQQAEAARGVLEHAGAESIDQAREKWWLGLRGVEKEHYQAARGDFDTDEANFRHGFEAALRYESHGKSFDENRAHLAAFYPAFYETEAFQRGYERGVAYMETIRGQNRAA